MQPTAVSLETVLAARDARTARTRHLLAAFPGRSLVCLTVNTPGPVKRTPPADRVFETGYSALRSALAAKGITVSHIEIRRGAAGCEAYLLAAAEPEALKRLTCALENSLPYGRLLDADVPGKDGAPLSRTALGLPERGCLVCGRPGPTCASRRLHPLTKVTAAFERLAALACPGERETP